MENKHNLTPKAKAHLIHNNIIKTKQTISCLTTLARITELAQNENYLFKPSSETPLQYSIRTEALKCLINCLHQGGAPARSMFAFGKSDISSVDAGLKFALSELFQQESQSPDDGSNRTFDLETLNLFMRLCFYSTYDQRNEDLVKKLCPDFPQKLIQVFVYYYYYYCCCCCYNYYN